MKSEEMKSKLDDITLIKGNAAKLHKTVINTSMMSQRTEKETPGDFRS